MGVVETGVVFANYICLKCYQNKTCNNDFHEELLIEKIEILRLISELKTCSSFSYPGCNDCREVDIELEADRNTRIIMPTLIARC